MKLAARTFRIQWDLHAWVGVITSLAAFVVFFFGVFALFYDAFVVWQDPALHDPPQTETTASGEDPEARVFDEAFAALARDRDIAAGSSVGLWRHEGTRWVTAYLTDPETGEGVFWVDPVGGEVVPERTHLAEELYVMHFFYRLPRGLEITGVLGIAILVALIGGLLIHLKDLRRQWWRFRPHLRLRHSASDAHKVLGVFGLPFALAITWSGAVICLGGLIGQGLTATSFDDDGARVRRLSGEQTVARAPADREAETLAPGELVRRARPASGGSAGEAEYLSMALVGDAHAWGTVYVHGDAFESRQYVSLDAVDGSILTTAGEDRTAFKRFEEVMWDVHFAEYGGRLLEFLYAVLALAMCAVILTGNLIWLERRDARRRHPGNRILERLTVGVAGGAVFATAVYLAANRILPWQLDGRADIEFSIFLRAWALATIGALLPLWSPRRIATGLLWGAALTFAGVTAVGLATREANLLTAPGRGLEAVLVVEILIALLALGCAALARGLRPHIR